MSPTEAELLRTHVQGFVRGFGLLAEDRTPCGKSMSPREAHALMLLLERERAGNAPRQNDLGAVLGIDKSNVTRLVQRLEGAGRIDRAPSDADARARLLRLTPKGKRLAESLEAASRARFKALCARIPVARRKAVISALALLGAALTAELQGESPDARR